MSGHRQVFAQADQLLRSGRMDAAEPLLRQILAGRPRDADALFALGVICNSTRRHGEAAELFRQVIGLKPSFAEAHGNLGGALYALGQFAGAAEAYRQAVNLKPQHAVMQQYLGLARQAAGDLGGAVEALQQALVLKPDYAEAALGLGHALRESKKAGEAEAAYRLAIALKPGWAEAHGAVGVLLNEEQRGDEAVAALQRAIALKPEYWFGVGVLAGVLRDIGRPAEALPLYERYMARNPEEPATHAGMLYAMEYLPAEVGALTAAYKGWAQRHADPLMPKVVAHGNARDPEKRLRVGYVSPDFREHSVAFFVENLLAAHHPEQVEVFCYSDVGRPDAVTARMRALVPQWRETTALTRDAFVEAVRADGIDILVDLAGHTAGNRLTAFAMRPAPVQMSWLGHINTTGMSQIDYRLADVHTDPVGMTEALHTEELVRLERTLATYRPPEGAPEVSPLPALGTGQVTFAALTVAAKANGAIVEAWAAILSRVAGSRMILAGRGFSTPSVQERVRGIFAKAGVGAERVEFISSLGFAEYLALHGRIDILLDPFPITGHTITVHGLWMGVPTVSRAGERYVSRLGASVLTNMGLGELLARTHGEYVEKAVALAGDLPGLAALRRSLRERLAASPIMDAAGFARELEGIYRRVWLRWVERGAG